MLRELWIKNFAIIDDLRVRFDAGLNVLTGETGAGKTIIIDALSLALGSRAQSDLVRAGEKEAVVQAYFEIERDSKLPDIGIDISHDLILRRSISLTGKSRAYINDTMVNIQSLSEIGKFLVDIHGQHEHQSLLSVDTHRLLLDAYGRLRDYIEKVESLYHEVQALKKEADELTQKIKERSHRLDLLRFQIHEIDAASLRHGEKEGLSEEKKILSNLSRLNELTEAAYSILYGSEGSCMEKFSSVVSKAREMASIDQSISNTLNVLESALPLIEETVISLRGCKDKYNIDPEKLTEIEERLELIKRLERKYGEGIATIFRYRVEAEKELTGLELSDERLDSIEAELKVKEEMLINAARSLSEKRKKIARKIEELVENELRELAFGKAEFKIDIRQEALTSHGLDRVEFMFSANPGEPPKPLVKIASGGELSRVMLALKGILADVDNIPILIFDEVDAGIGGKTAESVGMKLKTISNKHQVLCTTHLPQIASLGDFHIKIEKRQKDGRVCVDVTELSGKERQNEIARMLSGRITEMSLKHARELLGSTQS
jgi:DNA repair protein RecN (Recombination protein N)